MYAFVHILVSIFLFLFFGVCVCVCVSSTNLHHSSILFVSPFSTGSHMEVLYSLNTFGLSREYMPLDNNFNVTTDKVMLFIRKRREIEDLRELQRARNGSGLVDFPRSLDVVLGRGRPYQGYPGNMRLATFIDQQRAQYQSLDRLNKTHLSLEVVRMIKNSGGRFLKRCDDDSGRWWEVPDDVAREKVSHGFRTKTRRRSLSYESESDSNFRKRVKFHP